MFESGKKRKNIKVLLVISQGIQYNKNATVCSDHSAKTKGDTYQGADIEKEGER